MFRYLTLATAFSAFIFFSHSAKSEVQFKEVYPALCGGQWVKLVTQNDQYLVGAQIVKKSGQFGSLRLRQVDDFISRVEVKLKDDFKITFRNYRSALDFILYQINEKLFYQVINGLDDGLFEHGECDTSTNYEIHARQIGLADIVIKDKQKKLQEFNDALSRIAQLTIFDPNFDKLKETIIKLSELKVETIRTQLIVDRDKNKVIDQVLRSLREEAIKDELLGIQVTEAEFDAFEATLYAAIDGKVRNDELIRIYQLKDDITIIDEQTRLLEEAKAIAEELLIQAMVQREEEKIAIDDARDALNKFLEADVTKR